MNPKIIDKDTKRREILGAAVRMFARQGYAATTIADIAHEAGVAKGTIYLYFASRDEVLLAAFDAFEEELLAAVRTTTETAAPAFARLRAMLSIVLSRLEAEPNLARIALDFWAAGAFGGEQKGIDFGRIYAVYRRLVRELLAEAASDGSIRAGLPEETAAVIIGTIEGVLLQSIVDPQAVPLRRMAEPVLDILLNGLTGGVRPEGRR